MKDKWRNYALSPGKIKENYQSKYIDRSKSRKVPKPGNCNSIVQGGKEQEEIIYLERPEIPEAFKEIIDEEIKWYGKIVCLTEQFIFIGEKDESVREKHVVETYQEGRQGVQSSDQGRCEAQEITKNNKGKIMAKETKKAERKHEAKETKAYERKEDKKESKSKKK